ncbi:MAG TPA: hypothetical protein RMG48_01725 [Myxococcales bacterium LLY-WYZ-16_1]|nr:hypothetical protein [Myxococcales bacterium LLY-WYZ-16_1]
MSHPTWEQLWALRSAGEDPPPHLEECPRCRARWEQLESFRRLFSDMGQRAPDELSARRMEHALMAAVTKEDRPPEGTGRPLRPMAARSFADRVRRRTIRAAPWVAASFGLGLAAAWAGWAARGPSPGASTLEPADGRRADFRQAAVAPTERPAEARSSGSAPRAGLGGDGDGHRLEPPGPRPSDLSASGEPRSDRKARPPPRRVAAAQGPAGLGSAPASAAPQSALRPKRRARTLQARDRSRGFAEGHRRAGKTPSLGAPGANPHRRSHEPEQGGHGSEGGVHGRVEPAERTEAAGRTRDAGASPARHDAVHRESSGGETVVRRLPQRDPFLAALRRAERVYGRDRNPKAALRALADARELAQTQVQRLEVERLACDIHVARHEVEKALASCGADTAHPHPERRRLAHFVLGNLYRQEMGDCARAIAEYDQALVFGQPSLYTAEAMRHRAACAIELGRLEQAEADLWALEQRPSLLSDRQAVRRLRRRLEDARSD